MFGNNQEQLEVTAFQALIAKTSIQKCKNESQLGMHHCVTTGEETLLLRSGDRKHREGGDEKMMSSSLCQIPLRGFQAAGSGMG